MIHGAFGKCRGNGSAVFFKNVLFERAAVDTDTDRNSVCFAFISDRFDFLIGTDISRIDTDFIDPCLCGGESNLIIKMNITDKRNFQIAFLELGDRFASLNIGQGQTDDVTSCCLKLLHLPIGRFKIMRIRVRHGLYGNRVISADRNVSDVNHTGYSAFIHIQHNLLLL